MSKAGQGGQHFGELVIAIHPTKFAISYSCDHEHENGQDDDFIQTEELAAQLDKDLPGGSPAITSWPKYGELLSDQTSERRCFDDREVGDQLATADVLFVLR